MEINNDDVYICWDNYDPKNNFENKMIIAYIAKRDFKKDEEIYTSYGKGFWFTKLEDEKCSRDDIIKNNLF